MRRGGDDSLIHLMPVGVVAMCDERGRVCRGIDVDDDAAAIDCRDRGRLGRDGDVDRDRIVGVDEHLGPEGREAEETAGFQRLNGGLVDDHVTSMPVRMSFASASAVSRPRPPISSSMLPSLLETRTSSPAKPWMVSM